MVKYRKSQKVLAQTKLICFNKYRCRVDNADLAQLAEHVTSNDEVGGSNPLVSINFYKLALKSLLLRFYKYFDNRLFACFLFLVDSYAELLIFNFCHTTATKIEFDNFCVVKLI